MTRCRRMALYIQITKVSDSDMEATYEFGPTDELTGTMKIDKMTGKVTVVLEVGGDSNDIYAPRVARTLIQHWNSDEYPDRTRWAS